MTDFHTLYADTAKPSWAGGTYNPEQLTEGRNLDTKILSKRSGSRDLEISLPSELVGKTLLTGRYLFLSTETLTH